ncbi:hydantoinase/oxoprolinase family protein [Desulfosporosinus sp. BICA1-9]|uniref:hydantoinase/oxoprolinase family protein n=1 Tax=Desulfosporosinus sp. BICA1-9 TaxID=1531958 RepID=UPI000AE11729|nr:hydantoinase/oxoprolinase family protein [Desulfosporosinus sp. BICA1-9]HBW38404.1 5-oxoprolinase [Desulfosporosinus sp.]
MRIGIDVGGTFTDFVLVDDSTGRTLYVKASTTPGVLWEGVMEGLEKILNLAQVSMKQVDYIVHGTTIGTNAIIEHKGAKTGLITTKGFADVLEIGRIQRPSNGLYDFWVDNPLPLVPRHLRLEVEERVDAQGQILRPLTEADAIKAILALKSEGVEAIAVSTLFSFLNPLHEQRIGVLCHELFPEAYVSLSSEIAPEFREFERTSTTVMNAYLQPIMNRYISILRNKLKEKYGEVNLRIMQASGGTVTADAAEKLAIATVNSGPAGGAIAGAFIGNLTGVQQIINVDMGGTSFDISLIDDGVPKISSDTKFEGYPVKIPIIAIDAHRGGWRKYCLEGPWWAINVGPQSAGANPGPACYGRGGVKPTVTDANLVLGRLNPDYFLGGEITLDTAKALQAIEEHLAVPLGLSVEQTAAGLIKIVNANMAKGIGVNSVEKGYDVREFALVAFGGAGGLHVSELAQDLGIKKVIIPALAGNLSALGLLVADARHDYVRTVAKEMTEIDYSSIRAFYRDMESKGEIQLSDEGFSKENQELSWSMDLRYMGQSYELNVPFERREIIGFADIQVAADSFHELHKRLYAFSDAAEKVQLMNVRVTELGKTPPIQISEVNDQATTLEGALKGERLVYFAESGFVSTQVYERVRLPQGSIIYGPAVIEEKISATVLPPRNKLMVDQWQNLIITVGEGF